MDVTYRGDQSCLIPQIEDGDGYRMIKCLNRLYNVDSVTVSAPFLQAISELPTELENWPTPFSKLRYLHLETWLSRGCFQAIMFLLLNSPNIEALVLDMDPTKVNSANLAENGGVEYSLKFKLYHLQLVEFRRVTGSVAELEYLKILLENAVTLKKVSILTSKIRARPKERELDFPKEVFSLPRASSDVTIDFC